ncbi:hypothetical protein [Rhizobium sp. AN83]|uniref:hypothetical protein n=1 Tax=Rhizobium sp. AN83 TaxID=3035217 RepID=UPI002B2616A1|nr:hypothetical protein [Rhizobium sp. AN83]
MDDGRKAFEEGFCIKTRARQNVIRQKSIKPVINGKTEFIGAAHMRLLFILRAQIGR